MLGRGGASLGRWARYIDANDTDPALTVNQRSTGNILVLQDNGVAVFTVADGGGITHVGAYTHTGAVTISRNANAPLTVTHTQDAASVQAASAWLPSLLSA